MRITLKAARVNAGLTQEQAAKLLQIPRGVLIEIEKGNVAPTRVSLEQMSSIYKCSVSDFLLSETLTASK